MTTNLLLLTREEAALRREKILHQMESSSIDAILITTNTNLYYVTGRVYSGYTLLLADGTVKYFVKRPVQLEGDDTYQIRKPEDIPAIIGKETADGIATIGLELGALNYNTALRLKALFPDARLADASVSLTRARAVKTPTEIEKIRLSGAKHDRVYSLIPKLYTPGMTDIELQIEMERVMRLEGCLGMLRVNGDTMEIHMGNLLAGDNADVPSPYDFTMGGAGLDPSMPVGADGSLIKPGQTVMADMNGNFNGYMTDMSRVFAVRDVPENAMTAHQCCIDICRELANIGKPGFPVKSLYDRAVDMVKEAGLEQWFMGHRQHASFIGHGVGIEINEMPVLTARSKETLEVGNVIAIEPKMVFPGIGAVGIENTYLVTSDGMESFNHAPEKIVLFE